MDFIYYGLVAVSNSFIVVIGAAIIHLIILLIKRSLFGDNRNIGTIIMGINLIAIVLLTFKLFVIYAQIMEYFIYKIVI